MSEFSRQRRLDWLGKLGVVLLALAMVIFPLTGALAMAFAMGHIGDRHWVLIPALVVVGLLSFFTGAYLYRSARNRVEANDYSALPPAILAGRIGAVVASVGLIAALFAAFGTAYQLVKHEDQFSWAVQLVLGVLLVVAGMATRRLAGKARGGKD